MKSSLRLNRIQRGLQFLARFGSQDFCPSLNRYVYWLKQPIGWFTSAGCVALILGLFGEAEAFAVAGAIFGLVVLGIAWPAIAVRCVSATLHWRKLRCEEGESLESVLDVVNCWPWSVWGLIVESDDHIVNGGAEQKESVSLASVPAISSSRFVWQAIPQKRGEYPQQTAHLSSGFPFGLWMARRPLTIEQSILVWPKTIDLGNMPALDGKVRSVVGAWIDRPGTEGDVIGVRPYREGDSLRHVHWAQSARHDSLVVCERQSIARRSLRLEIFPSEVESLLPSQDAVQEWLIRIGGSVARTFLSHHWSVHLNLSGLAVKAEPGTQGLHRILDSLARWKSSSCSNESATAHSDSSLSNTAIVQRHSWRRGAIHNASLVHNNFALGIADVSSYRKFSESGEHPSCRWIVVDRERRLTSLLGSNANLWFSIDLDQSVWPQLSRHWSRICWNVSRNPSLSTIDCACDS